MCSTVEILRRDEELVLGLRRLYESYGYKKFKMKKFEQYDLYLENKSFLKNANIITVTDPKGRLLALKPDITLSIVKNLRSDALPEKVYYNENVYIADSDAGEIKETTQVGLEYIGELDVRSLGEILLLAAESLKSVDDDFCIAISHMGFLSEILDLAGFSESDKIVATDYISGKNLHGLRALCDKLSISEDIRSKLCGLITVSGELGSVIESAGALVCGELSKSALGELSSLAEIISSFGLSDKYVLDFSVMSDLSYYNGLVFQGFINGIPKSVLSGGRYDKLVNRFGINSSAIGFAVSVDMFGKYDLAESEFDFEVFLQYDVSCDSACVLEAQKSFVANGERCLALSEEPKGLKYVRKVVMSADGSMRDE